MIFAPPWVWCPENIPPAVTDPKVTRQLHAAYYLGAVSGEVGVGCPFSDESLVPLFTAFHLGRKVETGDDWQPVAAVLFEELVQVGFEPIPSGGRA